MPFSMVGTINQLLEPCYQKRKL